MSPIVATEAVVAIGASSAAIGAMIGAAFMRAEAAFWRLRAEQLLRRQRAMRSTGREATLFPDKPSPGWISGAQETPPG